jgi:hypothetical protein
MTLATSDAFWVDVDMRNANALKMVFSTDTADADDTMDVLGCSDYNRR